MLPTGDSKDRLWFKAEPPSTVEEVHCTPGFEVRCPQGDPRKAGTCTCACKGRNHGKITRMLELRLHEGK